MWRCPYCETFNEDTDNFCAICGGSRPAASKTEKTSAEVPFTAVETSAAASPAPRPRPANMWDGGEGLGGAKDLRAMAVKREAEHREKKVRDAEIRRKLAAKKPDTEKDAEYERMKYESSASKPKKSRGILLTLIIIAAIILIYILRISSIGITVPPTGTDISLTSSEVVLKAMPKIASDALKRVSSEDSIRYLGEIKSDIIGNKWCKVSVNGVIGYIDLDYIEFE